jgi:hypothetical protein
MVADPRSRTGADVWFHGHEVNPDGQSRRGASIGQTILDQPPDGRPKVTPLAMVECLLGEPEVTAAPPADLDDDEGRRRARVDRHEIELVATDMDVPGQDGPTGLEQSDEDQRFGGVTCLLCLGPCRDADRAFHGPMVTALAALARIGGCTAH